MSEDGLWDLSDVRPLKGLKIVLWNLRSLFPKIDDVRDFIHNAGGVDILCVNESWLKPPIPDSMINIEGFNVCRNDRVSKRGEGTCIFVNNRINFDTLTCLHYSDKDVEIQGVMLTGNEQSNVQKPILLVLVYRPPSGNGDIVPDIIKDKLQQINDIEKKEIIILGDFNWHCSGSRSNPHINNLCDELNLEQIIEHSTRVSYNREMLMDVIMTNVKNISYSGCINDSTSIHLPVFLVKKRQRNILELYYICKRSFENYDRDVFADKLAELDWSVLELLCDVNLAWQMVYKGLLAELN